MLCRPNGGKGSPPEWVFRLRPGLLPSGDGRSLRPYRTARGLCPGRDRLLAPYHDRGAGATARRPAGTEITPAAVRQAAILASEVAASPSSTDAAAWTTAAMRSEEQTSELQSLMRISYAVFCLKKKNNKQDKH